MLLGPGDGEIVNGLAGNRWVLATVGAAKISLFMSGILSKVSKRYCNGSLVTGDGVVEAKFDEWESVKGDPDASWGINSTIGLISPSDFSSLSPEKSKHCKSEGVNNSEVRSDGFFFKRRPVSFFNVPYLANQKKSYRYYVGSSQQTRSLAAWMVTEFLPW